MSSAEIVLLKDVVLLTFQFPAQYAALKRIGCLFLSQVSLLMKDMGMAVQADVKSFLDYILQVIDNKYLMMPAARAFRNICLDHAKIL